MIASNFSATVDSSEYVKIIGSSKSGSKTGRVLSIGEGTTASPTPKSILKDVFVLPMYPIR
jgi:hypothetical protein